MNTVRKTKILPFILAFALLLSCTAFAAPEEDSYEQVRRRLTRRWSNTAVRSIRHV